MYCLVAPLTVKIIEIVENVKILDIAIPHSPQGLKISTTLNFLMVKI